MTQLYVDEIIDFTYLAYLLLDFTAALPLTPSTYCRPRNNATKSWYRYCVWYERDGEPPPALTLVFSEIIGYICCSPRDIVHTYWFVSSAAHY